MVALLFPDSQIVAPLPFTAPLHFCPIGDSQWDPPLANESPSLRAIKPLLPAGWTALREFGEGGGIYYYNRNTGVSTWTLPQGEPTAAPTESESMQSPQQQQQHQHQYQYQQPEQPITPQQQSPSPATTPSPPSPLPTGWSAMVDEATNATYYYSSLTGTSQWERPDCAAALPPPPPTPSSRLAPGWIEALDPASGNAYFYNALSGASSWDMPLLYQ